MNIHQQPETYQVALFLHCNGPEALKFFMPSDNAQEREKLESTIKIWRIHDWRNKRKVERYVLYSCHSKPSMHMWQRCVHFHRHVTSECECIRESLIRDRIVLRIQNPQTRKRLLRKRKLTLYKCSDICSSSETRTSQMKIISGTKTSEDGNRVKEKVKNRVIKAARENPTRMKSMTNHENPAAFCGGIHLFKK